MISAVYRLADALRDRARRGRWTADQATGRRGEDLAHRFLRKQGYRIVARNYRTATGHGEVDVIAWDGDALVFVEVKTRADDSVAAPSRAIGEQKTEALAKAAREYARRSGTSWDCVRFDVVTVILCEERPKIALKKNAIER